MRLYLFKAFVDTESLVLELYHIVLLVVVFLVAKEFWKMCQQLAIWYSILALELNVYFSAACHGII
jgi:hypothetical protein